MIVPHNFAPLREEIHAIARQNNFRLRSVECRSRVAADGGQETSMRTYVVETAYDDSFQVTVNPETCTLDDFRATVATHFDALR